ncbi:cytochrome b [Janthinobacterium sp.]|uniref:cytochrome b n=1 Tax=Janthinobacterium sp. TaxID=1871054 RepID=UPI00293D5EF1|nr:cytochrome b [Janthinobacterium sp.]
MFGLPSRIMHWLMAVLLMMQLLAGAGMVATVSVWHERLIALHKPLGICLLALAILRLVLRRLGGAPPLPASMPGWQRRASTLSHYALYALMLGMPLLGWAMQSAAAYPMPGVGAWHVPAIMPQNVALYAWLRWAHGVGGQVFFVTVLIHIGAGLLHALVIKDGVFAAITRSGGKRPRR